MSTSTPSTTITADEYIAERTTVCDQISGSLLRGFWDNLENVEGEPETDDGGVYRVIYQRDDLDAAYRAAEEVLEAA